MGCASTEGSEDGYQIAFEWCKKNAEKFEVSETVSEMWYERIAACPPNLLHVGTIFALANFYQPGFTADWNRQHEKIDDNQLPMLARMASIVWGPPTSVTIETEETGKEVFVWEKPDEEPM
jgi:hypothetical protein